jgi:hypothetical protein
LNRLASYNLEVSNTRAQTCAADALLDEFRIFERKVMSWARWPFVWRIIRIVLESKRKQAVEKELAILVRVLLDDAVASADPLDELTGLATTAGARIVGSLIQRRPHPHVTTFLGSGKVAELKRLVEFHAADVVIFDNDLSPAQVRNLESELKVKVIDRTELILDIFATSAQTFEARLAVELAQLEYSLPRLKRMWTHLSRIKMGVGMRGPGEKQLEVDRRLVEKRIHDLRVELRGVEERKQRQVASHDGVDRRLYQRRQKHVDERFDGSQCAGCRQAVCHTRHANAALAIAELGSRIA